MTKKLKIQVNINIGKIKKGSQIMIDVDNEGIPLDKFWRKRLKDSAIDNCIQVISADSDNNKSAKPVGK